MNTGTHRLFLIAEPGHLRLEIALSDLKKTAEIQRFSDLSFQFTRCPLLLM